MERFAELWAQMDATFEDSSERQHTPGKTKHNKAREQVHERLATLRSRRQSRLTGHHALLNSRRAALHRDRDATQGRIDTLTRCLGPQFQQGPNGLEPTTRIDLAKKIPDYIGILRDTGSLLKKPDALVDALNWHAVEKREQVEFLNPNLVNVYTYNQELAKTYACGLGKGVAARTGMEIVTLPPPRPELSPVREGQLPKDAIYGDWDVVAWNAAVECARCVGETRVESLEDKKVRTAELEEIRKLEAELGRKDSPLEGGEGSVENPIDLDTMNSSSFDAMSPSLFGDTTKW